MVPLTLFAKPTAVAMLHEIYAEVEMKKNPFHMPEMPRRTEGFGTKIAAPFGGRYGLNIGIVAFIQNLAQPIFFIPASRQRGADDP